MRSALSKNSNEPVESSQKFGFICTRAVHSRLQTTMVPIRLHGWCRSDCMDSVADPCHYSYISYAGFVMMQLK